MHSRQRQVVYLCLSVIGLIGCWYFNIQWLRADRPHSIKGFIEAGFANSGSSSLSWDLAIGGLAACVFMVVEAHRRNMRNAWLYPVLFITVAFAFAFPLFLFMRERNQERLRV